MVGICRKKYNSAGWRIIFIDENKVNVKNWKELCLTELKGGKHMKNMKIRNG